MAVHHRTLLLLLLLCTIAPIVPTAQAQTQPIEQMRAFWADSYHPGYFNPAQADELVENVVRANANTIFVQVRRHADAWYNRSIDPRAIAQSLAPAETFDPLDYLIQRAHARGIAVHAWLVISVACRSTDALRDHPSHVCTSHGPAQPDPLRWTTATYGGTQVGDLDYGHPAAVNYIQSVVQDLLRNYPTVDGIHYDYIRYGDAEYGYNAISLARFRAAYGLPPEYRPAPRDPAWSQWRRDRLTELVRRLYIRIKAINPHTQVSAATITWGGVGSYSPDDWPNSAAYARVFQDWPAWLNEGILDFAVPMHYFDEDDPRAHSWYESWITWDRSRAGRRAIVAGTGAWLNNAAQGLDQIQRALAPDAAGRTLAGVALYSYDQPLAGSNPQRRSEFLDTLRATVFATPARAPIWPWIANPTTGHLQGMAAIDGQLIPHAHITLLRQGGWYSEQTASIDGWYGAVDLPPDTYSVLIRDPASGRTIRIDNLTISAGLVMSGP